MDAVLLTGKDRARVWPGRSLEWHGFLTPQQFLARNERLYAHRYPQQAMVSWALRDSDGSLPASLDVFNVTLRLTDGSRVEAGLIASVLTERAARGRGLATKLMKAVVEREPQRAFVLYADVGPKFYERFGFVASPVIAADVPADADGAPRERLDADEFLRRMQASRAVMDAGSACLWPSPDYLDWVQERYRFAAEAAGRPFPPDTYWGAQHGGEAHAIAVAPSFFLNRADVLWQHPQCEPCNAMAAAIAERWGLGSAHWWEPADETSITTGKCDWPMIKMPGTTYTDVQLLDWW